MSRPCVCETQGEAGPSTHRCAKHLSSCDHSTLGDTTKRSHPTRFKRVPGVRGFTAERIKDAPRPQGDKD